VDKLFREFYDRMGGTDVLGKPLTTVFERDDRSMQIFANFALEHWAENIETPYEVQPSLLGTWVSGSRFFGQVRPFRSSELVMYVPQTRQSLRFGFLNFWRTHGGIDLLGFPISEEIVDNDVVAQWFQRGKLTYDPTQAQAIQIADLGRQWITNSQDGLSAFYEVDGPHLCEAGTVANARVSVTNSGTETWPATGDNAVTLGFRWADRHPPRNRELPVSAALPADVSAGDRVELTVTVPLPEPPGPFRLQPDLRQHNKWFSANSIASPVIPLHAQLKEPGMRVGLLDVSSDNPSATRATVTSSEGLRIIDEGGQEMAELPGGATVMIRRDIQAERQVLDLPGSTQDTTLGPVTIEPTEGSMLRLAETSPWQTYRGSMEFVWLARFNSAWVINSLPIEDYLSGIAEQADGIPWEALRASAIAFRSYAIATRSVRRARNLVFDAASSTRHTPTMFTRHQVYHGMAREFSGTRLRDAVEDTRGQVMTHNGNTIMAVYFSRADGRTRSWHKEWGGRLKPWAVDVPDPYSTGQRLLGHGIGLPLQSANAMAATDANGEEILVNYYTDVDFNFIY
jgi:hypothetical protein